MYVRSTVSGNTIDKVSDLLFRYRNIPYSTTGKRPAELFLKRVPKTRLSFLKPSLQESVEYHQEVAKTSSDCVNPKDRKVHLFQKVRILNLRGGGEKWIKASLIHIEGMRTYVVRTVNGKERSIHIDHIIPDDFFFLILYYPGLTRLKPVYRQIQRFIDAISFQMMIFQ